MYKCDVCNKSFKGHIKVRKHVMVCYKILLYTNMQDHMRTHATDSEDKPYKCNQCGAKFNQRSQLTVHMRVHTGERPYSCKICSRSFSHSTALKLHLRMHTGEKPHTCKLCNKVDNRTEQKIRMPNLHYFLSVICPTTTSEEAHALCPQH